MRTIGTAVFSRFAHQGQVCMCANRILAQRSIYSKFLDRFVDRVSRLKAGDPRDPRTDLGPLMNQRQTETFMKQVQRGIDEGARVALRGKAEGNVVSPTVFADVTPNMWVARNEVRSGSLCDAVRHAGRRCAHGQ